jgi:hypothetical protein
LGANQTSSEGRGVGSGVEVLAGIEVFVGVEVFAVVGEVRGSGVSGAVSGI